MSLVIYRDTIFWKLTKRCLFRLFLRKLACLFVLFCFVLSCFFLFRVLYLLCFVSVTLQVVIDDFFIVTFIAVTLLFSRWEICQLSDSITFICLALSLTIDYLSGIIAMNSLALSLYMVWHHHYQQAGIITFFTINVVLLEVWHYHCRI